MSVLAGTRPTTPPLQRPHVLLSGSAHIMSGPFGVVTQNLLSLGSVPIEKLAESPKADLEGFDLPYVQVPSHLDLPPASSQLPPDAGDGIADEKEKKKAPTSMQFVAQLHQACLQTFGNSEGLNFEFIEENGPDRKQCILSITRPNGLLRSYTTEPEFDRKSDAKAHVAAIAVEMGAIDFILHGNKDNAKSLSSLVLAPIDGKSTKQEPKVKEESPAVELEDDEASKQIQSCCVEWRASQVVPRWVFYTEHKGATQFGCVLVVELSPHSQRVYSVGVLHESKPSAKKGCSELAIRQGILEFIKFGNGQTVPTVAPVEPPEQVIVKEDADPEKKGRTAAIPLQTFFDSLPKPFPEPVGDKAASDVNAAGMLNTILQLAKGARLSLHFYFLNEPGLHGCILRLVRPNESRTYMAEPKFAKRADAKAAVCLLAMSQGIGQYIRSIATAIENLVTPEMRKKANEQILPILGSEYAKLRQGMHPTYEFEHEQGAFGCTLVLSLSASPSPEEVRKWSVPADYRTKADAKVAVVYRAGAEAVEFVRFRGQPAPPDHDPFKPYKRPKAGSQALDMPKKPDIKKEDDEPVRLRASAEPRPTGQKLPSTSGQVKLGLSKPGPPLLETKEEAMARRKAEGTKWVRNQPTVARKPSFTYPPRPPGLSAPGPSRFPAPPYSGSAPQYGRPYDVAAAASAVIDRLTGPSLPTPPPSRPPYGPAPYPASAIPFPTHSGPPYPPPNVYQLPTASPPLPAPVYDMPRHPPIPIYYADSRAPHYSTPAIYSPPPPHPPPTRAHAFPTSTPTPAPTPHPTYPPPDDRPSQPERREGQIRYSEKGSPPGRAVSFSGGKERQKRPRSRERSLSDAQQPKKQRSSSLTSSVRVKEEVPSPTISSNPSSSMPSVGTGQKISNVAQLLQFCSSEGIQRPEFCQKAVKNEHGEEVFKIWVVMGKERLELPTLYQTVNEGKQRLAKQVLQRLKTQSQGS